MDPELKLAYEQIDNQILRILLYFGGAVISTLVVGLMYLWRQWRADLRERTLMDREGTSAAMAVASALQGLRQEIEELRGEVREKS